jgi:hypothetical protein
MLRANWQGDKRARTRSLRKCRSPESRIQNSTREYEYGYLATSPSLTPLLRWRLRMSMAIWPHSTGSRYVINSLISWTYIHASTFAVVNYFGARLIGNSSMDFNDCFSDFYRRPHPILTRKSVVANSLLITAARI